MNQLACLVLVSLRWCLAMKEASRAWYLFFVLRGLERFPDRFFCKISVVWCRVFGELVLTAVSWSSVRVVETVRRVFTECRIWFMNFSCMAFCTSMFEKNIFAGSKVVALCGSFKIAVSALVGGFVVGRRSWERRCWLCLPWRTLSNCPECPYWCWSVSCCKK